MFKRFKRHNNSLIIIYAIMIHLLWGICLLNNQAAGNATAVHTMLEFISAPYAAILYIAVALLALIGLFCRKGLGAILALLPQQFVLMISAGGVLYAMWNGTFADGIHRAHEFLIADQAPAVIAAILHTVALIMIINEKKK